MIFQRAIEDLGNDDLMLRGDCKSTAGVSWVRIQKKESEKIMDFLCISFFTLASCFKILQNVQQSIMGED